LRVIETDFDRSVIDVSYRARLIGLPISNLRAAAITARQARRWLPDPACCRGPQACGKQQRVFALGDDEGVVVELLVDNVPGRGCGITSAADPEALSLSECVKRETVMTADLIAVGCADWSRICR